MTGLSANLWENIVGFFGFASVTAVSLWLVLRKRPTADELERARRQFLVQSGRLVDGMLLDSYEVEVAAKSKSEPARTLTMLLYSYHIGGVDYECSQDITAILSILDLAQVRPGFPCTARYQPGNPQNSIVIAEEWTGLRMGLPAQHVYDDPEPLDVSHLRPGRG
ncbi:MAG: hypothetical protein ABR956_02365 [Terracidiphilus sp.]|jgi:hypothetical protein